MDYARRRRDMGAPFSKDPINLSQPLKTRGGSAVRIYEIFYGDYVNGAYYAEDRDVWFPIQWGWDGAYAQKKSALDLVNS